MSASGPYGTGPGPIRPGSGRGGPGSGRGGGWFRGVALVAAGIGVALLLTCVGVGTYVWRTPEFQESLAILHEGQTGAAAQALQQAGCEGAMVLDSGALLERLARLVGVDPARLGSGKLPVVGSGPVVACVRGASSPALRCEDVARIYLGVVSPAPRRFVVQVTSKGEATPMCQDVYDESGRRLGSAAELERARREQGPTAGSPTR